MLNRNRFVWKQIIFIALMTTAGSFVFDIIRPGSRQAEQTIQPSATQPGQEKKGVQGVAGPKAVKEPRGKQPNTAFAPLGQVARSESLASFMPAQFQGKTLVQVKLSSKEKVIALTFDDGPWPKTTEQVLDILKQQNIKATFFCVGEMVQKYPQIAQLVVADGQEIGNHTWHHWYRRMNPSTAAREIESTEALIYETTGVKTSLFRPPGGILNNGVADYAKKNNYAVMMWSDDSIDYRRPSVSRLVNNVLRYAQPGGIVLLHDGGGKRSQTVKALPKIIAGLKERGYQFVTVSELLELKDKELKLATPSPMPAGAVQKPQAKG